MTPKYSIVIGTIDRAPRKNYLGETLINMRRSGIWDSPVPFRLDIIDSGSPNARAYFDEQIYPNIPNATGSPRIGIHYMEPLANNVQVPQFAIKDKETGQLHRSRNANALECLRIGIASQAPWILFVEDDVDFCRDFLGSVDRWLARHARRDRHLYSFATPYKGVCQAWEQGLTSWDFPARNFYGNQALAFSRSDAISAENYIRRRLPTWDTGQGFDLLLKEWALGSFRCEFFLSSVPSFVQHMGQESSIHFGRFHAVSGWAGRDWSYASSMSEVADV